MENSQPIVVTAYFHPAPGCRENVVAALERVIPRVHEEPGCNLYCIQEAPDGTIVMIEHWDSAAELDAHGEAAPVADLNAELEGQLSRGIEVTRLRAIELGQPAKGALVPGGPDRAK